MEEHDIGIMSLILLLLHGVYISLSGVNEVIS